MADAPAALQEGSDAVDDVHDLGFVTHSESSNESTNGNEAQPLWGHVFHPRRLERDFALREARIDALIISAPLLMITLVFGIALGMLARDV